jgi:hypothetical protein
MNYHDDPTTTRTNATAYEPPVLILIGDAENVVLGVPGGGDDHFGFSPWQFEFEEDNDEGGAARA